MVNGANPSGHNGLLVKYSYGGTVMWAKVISGTGNCDITSVTVDERGNVWAAGVMSGNGATFSAGPHTSVTLSTSQLCAFTAKFGPDGYDISLQATPFTQADTQFKAVAVDGQGNLRAVGRLSLPGGPAQVDFGFGPKSFSGFGGANALMTKLQ